jgi:hypothetical protein
VTFGLSVACTLGYLIILFVACVLFPHFMCCSYYVYLIFSKISSAIKRQEPQIETVCDNVI